MNLALLGDSATGVSFVRDGAVAIASLSRPDVLNAVNDEIRRGLVSACSEVEADPALHALIIRGDGERSFCVGADIKEARSETASGPRVPSVDKDYTSAIAAMKKPVIAAIHGFCLGAGFEIALACDLRIASSCATFGLPEVNLGLIPGAGGTQRLTRLVGYGRALDMMLSGDRIDAQRALDYGIVTRIVGSRAELDEATLALARKLAAKSPLAVAALKDAVAASLSGTLDEGLARERELFTFLLGTEDRKEAAEAFKAKRLPRFVGR